MRPRLILKFSKGFGDMVITCVMSVPLTYIDKDGNPETVVLRPGSHNYPMLDHKDPEIAKQLRVYRKHGRIGFDELLETDVEILKKMDPSLKPEEKAKELLKAVSLKPSPVGKVVKGKKKNGGNNKPAKTAPKDSKTTVKQADKGKS